MQNQNMDQYDLLIFDCDGVLLDSNEIKTKGFIHTLKKFKLNHKQIKWAVDYHQKNGGISRYIKFLRIFQKYDMISNDVVNEKGNPDVLRAGEIYSKYVKERVARCNKIPGVVEILQCIPKQAYMYVVSGAKQEELREALHTHRLSAYFQGVFGSGPNGQNKSQWIDNIRSWIKVGNVRGLYFGDSILDYEVAKENGFDFIFLSGATDLKEWRDFVANNNIRAIKDFNNIKTTY